MRIIEAQTVQTFDRIRYAGETFIVEKMEFHAGKDWITFVLYQPESGEVFSCGIRKTQNVKVMI